MIYMLFSILILSSSSIASEYDYYDQAEKWKGHTESGGLEIPEDAVGRPSIRRLVPNWNRSDPVNHCHCTYGSSICDMHETCIKHPLAACFHAIEEMYNKKAKHMETRHQFGCAPLEKGSGASHLTCKSYLVPHRHLKSIACCYEGNHCNKDLEPPVYKQLPGGSIDELEAFGPLHGRSFLFFLLVFSASAIFLLLCLLSSFYVIIRRVQDKKSKKSLAASEDIEKEPMIDDSGSGSGSGQMTLTQRTVAKDLKIIRVIGRGRYGEVRKALYRGSIVAVKTFYTTDEDSWRNERDIYQTHMFNHENILQFVAADICSADCITHMLLITDYHELGSLSDYLRREQNLTLKEAIKLVYSIACGLEHVHGSVIGTDSKKKPEVAHRDMKSKNVLVKRPGHCCIADFGLAVRYEGRLIPEKVNVQVGTKRYMAPEVLSKTLNINSFGQFKAADIYSLALIMWEVARRVEYAPGMDDEQINGIISQNEPERNDSGVGESIENAETHRLQLLPESSDSSTKAQPYVPPFEGEVAPDPSFEEMRQVVCDRALRPPIHSSWTHPSNPLMCRLVRVMRTCWNPIPDRRHSALKVKTELGKLLENAQRKKVSVGEAEHYSTGADSGFNSGLNNVS